VQPQAGTAADTGRFLAHAGPAPFAMNLMLYLLTVLIWGTTWIALKLQLGTVPIAWSVAYRFALAAAVMFAWLAYTGRLKRPRGAAMGLIAAQGVFLFCLNFLCFLQASRYIPSGLVAVLFSTATVWNAFNARVFLKRPLLPRVLAGSGLGLLGLVALFWPELSRPQSLADTGLGIAYGLAGTLCFSIGNMLSTRLQATGHTPVVTNAWGMLIGASVLTLGCSLAGVPWAFEATTRYMGALLYLAIPGSVIGFTAYLTLVGRLGPEKAAYCTVLFPVVALNVSALVEGYAWSAPALFGLALVMAGNVLVFKRPAAR
jgi:drug/metabolite transporter (DMT)-like permease